MDIDLTPIASEALAGVFALALAIIGALARKALGLRQQDLDQRYLDDLADRAAALAISRIDRDGDGKLSYETKSALAAQAANYATRTAPELLKRLGANPAALRERMAAEIAKRAF